VSTLLAVLIVVVVTASAIGVMLFVRSRNAPDGSYFNDSDRSSGFFGVLATGFSVLLGFIVFLAFESYDSARAGAEAEATTLAQQFQTASFLPAPADGKLELALICYGRYVANVEWASLRNGSQPTTINPWSVSLYRTIRTVEPKTAAEQAAYAKWLDQTSDREQGRSDRLHAGEGVIPRPLWFVLFLAAGLIFVYMLFFADTGERKKTQALQVGTVTAVVTASLLLLFFLDRPYHAGAGSLQPVAMERSLRLMDAERRIAGVGGTLPCDASGRALASP
jgi:hypothetical protein